MNKKNIHRQKLTESVPEEYPESEFSKLLTYIHKKIDNSAALNGGFDRLLYKIDGIEKSQNQISQKVDKIHEAIYHPDDGIFSRIATNKASQLESLGKVEQQIEDISYWKSKMEKFDEQFESDSDDMHSKLQTLESTITGLEKYQALTFSIVKWFLVALGGGAITMFFKFFYEGLKQLP